MATHVLRWPASRDHSPVPVCSSPAVPPVYDLRSETCYRQLNSTTKKIILKLEQARCPDQHVRDVCSVPVGAFSLPPQGDGVQEACGPTHATQGALTSGVISVVSWCGTRRQPSLSRPRYEFAQCMPGSWELRVFPSSGQARSKDMRKHDPMRSFRWVRMRSHELIMVVRITVSSLTACRRRIRRRRRKRERERERERE